jgi:hypothetical protein
MRNAALSECTTSLKGFETFLLRFLNSTSLNQRRKKSAVAAMSNKSSEIEGYRAKIASLELDLERWPEDRSLIERDIVQCRQSIRQCLGRAGQLLNNCKMLNAAGAVLASIEAVEGGFHLHCRTLRQQKPDFINLGLLFSSDEIKTLASRLTTNTSPYLTLPVWREMSKGMGRRSPHLVDVIPRLNRGQSSGGGYDIVQTGVARNRGRS